MHLGWGKPVDWALAWGLEGLRGVASVNPTEAKKSTKTSHAVCGAGLSGLSGCRVFGCTWPQRSRPGSGLSGVASVNPKDPALTEATEASPTDRMWRFRGFFGLSGIH